MCIATAVSELWTRGHCCAKSDLDLLKLYRRWGPLDQADGHSMYRGFAMAEMFHHFSVVLLLIALVLFLYSMDRAAAISVSALAILYLVAHLL